MGDAVFLYSPPKCDSHSGGLKLILSRQPAMIMKLEMFQMQTDEIQSWKPDFCETGAVTKMSLTPGGYGSGSMQRMISASQLQSFGVGCLPRQHVSNRQSPMVN